MKNISINGKKSGVDLNRDIDLINGSLVILKNDNGIDSVYMVVSFRDNKNRYNGERTETYCTLLNLDDGKYAFEERCSRKTTVKRVLNHLLRFGGCSYVENIAFPVERYGSFDIEVYRSGEYTIDISC